MKTQVVSMRATETRRSSWLRRGAPVAVVFGGVAVALAAGARDTDSASVPAETLASASVAENVSTVAAPLEALPAPSKDFRKSPYSSVMVRTLPASKSAAKGEAQSGRRYLRPGAVPAPGNTTGYPGTTPTTVTKVNLGPGKGIARKIPASLRPAEMHSATAPGIRQCVNPLHNHGTKAVSR